MYQASQRPWRAIAACALLWCAHTRAAEYSWQLPPGFPAPVVPLDNPMSTAKVALGRRLFFDTRLSASGTYACANCHRPELAYTDGQARAVGVRGDALRRSAPSLANVAYLPAYTWADPTVTTLETQMRRPLFNDQPPELGLRGREAPLLARLAADPDYRTLFAQAFAASPAPLSMVNLIKAIACFERTLISGRSRFDRYVFDDDRDALTPAAKRGMGLFYSARVGCAQCHFGLNFSGPLSFPGQPRARAIYANTGRDAPDGRGGYAAGDPGLIEISHRRSDLGRFRVPTLRNIALTAPYMHDGRLASLEAVLDHYAGADGDHDPARQRPPRDPRVRPFTLSRTEERDLIEFLDSLSDPAFASPP